MKFVLAMAVRETRASWRRLLFFFICIAVGVAATITTLAALDLGLEQYDRERVHGHVLTRDGARKQLERLAALPLEQRRRVPALEPERAPVIVAGAAILVAILDAYDLPAIRASLLELQDFVG